MEGWQRKKGRKGTIVRPKRKWRSDDEMREWKPEKKDKNKYVFWTKYSEKKRKFKEQKRRVYKRKRIKRAWIIDWRYCEAKKKSHSLFSCKKKTKKETNDIYWNKYKTLQTKRDLWNNHIYQWIYLIYIYLYRSTCIYIPMYTYL